MEAVQYLDPVAEVFAEHSDEDARTAPGLVEMVLKEPGRLDALIRDESEAPELIPRLLAVALSGLAIYGVAATVVVNLVSDLPGWIPSARWSEGRWASLALAYLVGMVAANGVCLPSFYFYGLLAGVRLTMLQAAVHALKCLAVGSVVLVGILPIYMALALGTVVFRGSQDAMMWTVLLGLALPFLAGAWGVRSLYAGFVGLADTLPRERQVRRSVFLRRLTLAWSACYTVVTPLMIYWLWTHFAGR